MFLGKHHKTRLIDGIRKVVPIHRSLKTQRLSSYATHSFKELFTYTLLIYASDYECMIHIYSLME